MSTMNVAAITAGSIGFSMLTGSSIGANAMTVGSTLTASSLNAINVSYSTLQGGSIQSQIITASTLIGSTINFTNLTFSTLLASTMTADVMFPLSLQGSTMNITNLLTVSSNVGIGTTSANYPLSVSNTVFGAMELNRASTASNNFYAAGTVYTVTDPANNNFKGTYAYAFGGASAIATTSQSQARGYYAIDVANPSGLFGSDTTGAAGAMFYMDSVKTYFQNTALGVGTVSPSWPLTVAKDLSFAAMTSNPLDATLVITGKSNTGTLKIGTYYTGLSFGAAIQSSQFSGSDTVGALVLNPLGGNVGIGTNNPSQTFDVFGAIASSYTGKASIVMSGLNGTYGTIEAFQFGMYTNKYALILNPLGGNVGIGTVTPAGRLTSYTTSANHTAAPDGNPTNHQLILTNSKTGTTPYAMAIGLDQAFGIGYINAAGNSTYQHVCLQTRGGNVGIGTTNPTTALQVNGAVTVTGLITAGSDMGLYLTPSATNSQAIISYFQKTTNVLRPSGVVPFWANSVKFSTAGTTPGSMDYTGGVLLSDGRVVFVPSFSSAIGLFNPTTNIFSTVTMSPTPAGGAYRGGVLLPDGRVVFVPSNATTIGLFDPTAATPYSIITPVTPNNLTLGSQAYSGGVLLPNGSVVFVPYKAPRAGLFDPTTNSFIFVGPTISGGHYYFGGVLLPDGRVVFVPNFTTTVGLFNYVDNSITAFTVSATSLIYNGGVLLPDGRVVFVPGGAATKVGLFNPVDNSYTSTGNISGGGQAAGGVLLSDGRVIFIPSVTANIRLYDPILNTVTNAYDMGTVILYSSGGFSGGVLLPDGRVVFVPNSVNTVGIFTIPFSAPRDMCLSPYLNKY